MANHPHYALLPIFAGPYSRRRLVRFRSPVRHVSKVAAVVVAAGAVLALIL
jgi:hypothetical protein